MTIQSITLSRGRLFSQTLSSEDIGKAKAASSAAEARKMLTVWDKIKDFFSGSKKAEAMAQLYTFYHMPGVNEKMTAFYNINQLMDNPDDVRFSAEIKKGGNENATIKFVIKFDQRDAENLELTETSIEIEEENLQNIIESKLSHYCCQLDEVFEKFADEWKKNNKAEGYKYENKLEAIVGFIDMVGQTNNLRIDRLEGMKLELIEEIKLIGPDAFNGKTKAISSLKEMDLETAEETAELCFPKLSAKVVELDLIKQVSATSEVGVTGELGPSTDATRPMQPKSPKPSPPKEEAIAK